MGMFDEIRWDAALPEGHPPEDRIFPGVQPVSVATLVKELQREFTPTGRAR